MSADNPLFASGVLTATAEEVSLSEEFEEAVEEYLSRYSGYTSEEFAGEIEGTVDEDVVEPLATLGESDPRTIAEFRALVDRLDDHHQTHEGGRSTGVVDGTDADGATDVGDGRTVDDGSGKGSTALQVLPTLRLFRDDDVRADGAPEQFVPVPATQLPQLLRIYSPALVYAWLDDSERCDLAKRDLEAVFEEPQGVMPFAVYGPAYRDFLEREYSVTAGPAMLFTRDGEVEARLYGAHGAATIETELERHRH